MQGGSAQQPNMPMGHISALQKNMTFSGIKPDVFLRRDPSLQSSWYQKVWHWLRGVPLSRETLGKDTAVSWYQQPVAWLGIAGGAAFLLMGARSQMGKDLIKDFRTWWKSGKKEKVPTPDLEKGQGAQEIKLPQNTGTSNKKPSKNTEITTAPELTPVLLIEDPSEALLKQLDNPFECNDAVVTSIAKRIKALQKAGKSNDLECKKLLDALQTHYSSSVHSQALTELGRAAPREFVSTLLATANSKIRELLIEHIHTHVQEEEHQYIDLMKKVFDTAKSWEKEVLFKGLNLTDPAYKNQRIGVYKAALQHSKPHLREAAFRKIENSLSKEEIVELLNSLDTKHIGYQQLKTRLSKFIMPEIKPKPSIQITEQEKIQKAKALFKYRLPEREKSIVESFQGLVKWKNYDSGEYNDYVSGPWPKLIFGHDEKLLADIKEEKITPDVAKTLLEQKREYSQRKMVALWKKKKLYKELMKKEKTQLTNQDRIFIKDYQKKYGSILQTRQAHSSYKDKYADIGYDERIYSGFKMKGTKTIHSNGRVEPFEKTFSNETIVIDVARDENLQKNINEFKKLIAKNFNMPEEAKWRLMLNYINQSFPVRVEDALHILDGIGEKPALLSLGTHTLLGDCIEQGIGVCRHKALLTKILADEIGLEAAFHVGFMQGGGHAWNTVKIDKQIWLFDAHNCTLQPMTPELEKNWQQLKLS